jgi:putative redox protein
LSDILVTHEAGDRFRVRIRSHELLVDQPTGDGGEDSGPTPTELFVAGLASCTAFYAERYLRRHGLPLDGLAVECGFSFATDRPARVSAVDLSVLVPEGFPEDRRAGLLAVVEHCTVHNSIKHAPEISIRLESPPGPTGVGTEMAGA